MFVNVLIVTVFVEGSIRLCLVSLCVLAAAGVCVRTVLLHPGIGQRDRCPWVDVVLGGDPEEVATRTVPLPHYSSKAKTENTASKVIALNLDIAQQLACDFIWNHQTLLINCSRVLLSANARVQCATSALSKDTPAPAAATKLAKPSKASSARWDSVAPVRRESAAPSTGPQPLAVATRIDLPADPLQAGERVTEDSGPRVAFSAGNNNHCSLSVNLARDWHRRVPFTSTCDLGAAIKVDRIVLIWIYPASAHTAIIEKHVCTMTLIGMPIGPELRHPGFCGSRGRCTRLGTSSLEHAGL